MAEVSPEHLRGVMKKLDDQIRLRIRFYEEGEGALKIERGGKMRKPGLSSKSASHVWSEVTSGFKEAVSSKIDDLRILSVNPALGVQPPIRTKPREQEALFPSEVTQLLSCEAIPLKRRQLYAVAIYTAMRQRQVRHAAPAVACRRSRRRRRHPAQGAGEVRLSRPGTVLAPLVAPAFRIRARGRFFRVETGGPTGT